MENAHLEAKTEWATVNEHGIWCPLCGFQLEAPWTYEEGWEEPENCEDCGYPDDGEQMTEYFT